MSKPPRDPFEMLLTSNEPKEFRNYLAVPGEGLRIGGSAAQAIGTFRRLESSDLAIPASAAATAAPIDYIGVYMTLADYFPFEEAGLDSDDLSEAFASHHTAETLVVHLALLNLLSRNGERAETMTAEYERVLQPEVAQRFHNVLRGETGTGRVRFLARQPILAALRYVIEHGAADRDDPEVPQLLAATSLSHAVASSLTSPPATGASIAGTPEEMFFTLLRIALLYESDDPWSTIDRVTRIWRDFGTRVATFPPRKPPEDLLREATGLGLDEVLGLGFAIYAHALNWELGKPCFLDAGMGIGMDPETIEVFLSLVAATLDEYRAAFAQRSDSQFDFLPFQDRPVLRTEHGLLPLDIQYLWERVTSGLYWLVHDHERQCGDVDRQRWTQAFAEAIELFAEDALASLAPPVVGGGATFYTEEDLKQAYGEQKRCDAAVDFGHCIMLVEVVSGWLAIPTRIEGQRAQFEADTSRLVISKCGQLDRAAEAVLTEAARLTGTNPPAGLRVLPVLLVGGGYPITPFTQAYIDEQLATHGYLDDPMIDPLCVINLGELEMLEGLREQGQSVVDVLRGWKTSGIAEVSLRNYVLVTWSGGPKLRPARMEDSVKETFERIHAVLKITQP